MSETESDPERTQGPLGTWLRGCAMGAADIVPGVSGGTIALITGIYLRLLTALGAIPGALLDFLKTRRLGKLLQQTDAGFLLALMAGVLTSVFGLAHLITYLLEYHDVLVWGFFFGLILGAIVHIIRQIQSWQSLAPAMLGLGALLAWGISQLTPAALTLSGPVAFGAGALAISAMILPGISGSFILVLLGLYAPVLAAIRSLDLGIMAFFGLGCVVGLLSVARIVATALRRQPSATLALLTGFMIGALHNVWPWRVTITSRTRSDGSEAPLLQDNVLPFDYAQTTGEAHQLAGVLLLCAFGMLLVVGIEWASKVRQPALKE